MKRSLVAVAVAAVVGMVSVWTAAQAFHAALRPPHYQHHAVMVTIPRGATTRGIAARLRRRHLIRSALAFRLAARQIGVAGRLQAGTYRVTPEMDAIRILKKLAAGDVDMIRVVVPEGYTVYQIADLLVKKEFGDRQRIEQLLFAPPPSLRPPWLPGDRLEGYLFPSTYFVPVGGKGESVIRLMLDRFHAVVITGMAADLRRSPLTLNEVVTLASLVEREARNDRERPLIAGVLLNRLHRNMKLQCDATVQYGLGRHHHRLFFKDLTVDSPYNTYLHAGLPPGAIANPGEASLRAVLYPAVTDFLYYVARRDGSHIFSRTFAEHQRAIQAARGAS